MEAIVSCVCVALEWTAVQYTQTLGDVALPSTHVQP